MNKEESIKLLKILKTQINEFCKKNASYTFEEKYIEENLIKNFNQESDLLNKIKTIYNNDFLSLIIEKILNSCTLCEFSRVNLCLDIIINALKKNINELDFHLADCSNNVEMLELLQGISRYFLLKCYQASDLLNEKSNNENIFNLLMDSNFKNLYVSKEKPINLYYLYKDILGTKIYMPIKNYNEFHSYLSEMKNKKFNELDCILFSGDVNDTNTKKATQQDVSKYLDQLKLEIPLNENKINSISDNLQNKEPCIKIISYVFTSLQFDGVERIIQILNKYAFSGVINFDKYFWIRFYKMIVTLKKYCLLNKNCDINAAFEYYKNNNNKFFNSYQI